MEFGSAFVLSKPIDPAVDVEEIHEADYSEGVRSEMKKNVRARGDNVCLLDILDTAGQEEYSSLRDQYTRSASAYLIVFSIADRNSFDEAQAIYAFCCRLRGSGTVPAVLCANKCDLSLQRQVSTEDALRWANSQGIPMFETSAKLGTNIEEAFVKLVQVTPRTSHEYKIAVLGAGSVGKSSITVRFTQGHYVEEYDPTIEDSYRKQIVVPNLPPISRPARPTSSSTPLSNTARRSSGFFSSLFRFGSSSTQVPPAAPPTPPATLPTYDEATTKIASGSRKVRRIPKADTNVLTLNLGSLAPENFDMLEVRALQFPPPSCPSCSAVMSASPTCLMCAKHNPDAAPDELEVRRAAEEYTLLKGSKSPTLLNDGISPTVANMEDKGLVVFCIDISGSMSITQQVTQLQGMWNSFKLQQSRNNGTASLNDIPQAPTYISRLECMQDAMQVHLDRLETQFPERKVAVIAFDSELDCYVGGTRMPVIDTSRFKRIHDAMDAARSVRPAQWKTVRETVGVLRDRVKGLATKGATALGPALGVALGMAREHKRETGAATEIFLCTDGASNTGIGCTSSSYVQSADPSMHGRPFYAQAGEIALGQSAKINIIGIEGEGVALDVLSVAAQVSGGVVTMVKQDELRRQVRTASQRRVIAKDVTIKLYAAKGWQFTSDPRPGVIVDKNKLTYTLAQIDDETALGFAFAPPGGKGEAAGDPRPFQAQVTYTSPSTGDTKVRILNRLMPVTSDRTHAENAVEVALVGTYALQRIAFAASEVLVKSTSLTRANVKPEISRLRDELHAVHKMLIRGAKTNTQQEELGNFAHESAKLDQQLERMADGSMRAADKDEAVGSLTRAAALSQNVVFSGSKKVGQVKRRVFLK